MRVVSLVPSWTETLIEAGVEVVGRTRFCIHPESVVGSIAAIGGTKDWDWEKVRALKPDILLLDREENPKFMSEQSEIPFVDTHVGSIADVAANLEKIRAAIPEPRLSAYIERWREVEHLQARTPWDGKGDFPGLLQWGQRPTVPVQKIEYVIWKKPWMGIAKNTFIGSALAAVGFADFLPEHERKYPELDLESRKDKESTLLLFSSEPFPFAKIHNSLAELGYPYALVDGESFSWFGLRSLRFLEAALK